MRYGEKCSPLPIPGKLPLFVGGSDGDAEIKEV